MPHTPFSTRRTFIQTAGAALTVPLAAAAMVPDAAAGPVDPLQARLARLEDLDAIRALNTEFARTVGARGLEGIREMAAHGFGEQDVIEIAPDRQTATALLHCSVVIEAEIGPECPLVDMARQQGGGVVRRTARGVFAHAYLRRDGVWQLQQSSFTET